jgi:uncharacterized phage-associated protein
MLTCFAIADYFLAKTDEASGDSVSNLKLQKLLYYAQGSHLALYDKPLFPDPIEAWTHGPVVPPVYHVYKQYGSSPIPVPADFSFARYSEEIIGFLDEVYSVYGQFSAWKLRDMTHSEQPWIEAFDSKSFISHESMKRFFKTQLVTEAN